MEIRMQQLEETIAQWRRDMERLEEGIRVERMERMQEQEQVRVQREEEQEQARVEREEVERRRLEKQENGSQFFFNVENFYNKPKSP